MANRESKKQPWGRASAPLNIPESEDEPAKTIWIELGPVWQSENGSFQLELRSEPLHWRKPNEPRKIVIFKNEASR